MEIILKNATVITQNSTRDVLKGDIQISGNKIAAIGKNITVENIPVVDLSGKVVIPGFIQTHIHLCQTLFRNLADDMELIEWLETRIWPMEQAHTPDSLRASARLGLFELLQNGVTTIMDMGSARFHEVVFEELEHSGIRGFSGKVMMDAGEQIYKETTREAVQSTEELIRKWHGAAGGRIQYALAPRFVPTCSEDLWSAISGLSDDLNLLIHTHSSENRTELQMVQTLTGLRNVEFFVNRELASSRLCLAHCIWLNEREMEFLKEYQINVMHCPASNLKLASGIAPIPQMLRKGINVSLGSDGAPCNNNLDIFTDMRLAALIHKPANGVKSITAENVFDMATINGARTLGMEDKIGSLEAGKLADLVVLDLNQVSTVPADNFYSQIVYSASSKNVVEVMVDGEWVVRDGVPLAYQKDNIVRNAWKECNTLFRQLA